MSDKPRILTLRLKAKWWDKIASGEKTVELRLATDYWRKRLIGQHYDEIHLWKGYPPKTDTSKLLRRKWECVARETIVHPEFGPDPVEVFCISVAKDVAAGDGHR
jgi:hypothetical protein